MRIVLFITLCSLSIWPSTALAGDKIPALAAISDKLSDDQQKGFIQRRQYLQIELKSFQAAAKTFNDKTAENQNDIEFNAVKALRTKYIDAVTLFNRDLAAAEAISLRQDGPTASDLARDPDLAKSSRLRLDEINGRVERLQKAIDILGDSNPEWKKEWMELHVDQIESTHQLIWSSLDLVTAGIAEGCKMATEAQLEKAQEAFQGEDFKLLMTWATSKPHHASLNNWIIALGHLDKAVKNHNTAEAVARLREAAFEGREAYEDAKKSGSSTDAVDELYHGSLALGGVSVSLVGGVGGTVAAPVAALLKAGEAGLTIKLIREEDQQFSALSNQAFDRDQKKLELMKKKAELEDQASRLNMVLQRSEGIK